MTNQGSFSTSTKKKIETLDSKIAEGIMKTLPAEFKRKINFSEGSIQEQASKAQGQTNHVSNILVHQHQEDSAAYDEHE